jgi:hypothetical protein
MKVENSERSVRQRDIPSEVRPKYLSPPRLVAIIALTVFLGEVSVMIVLESLPEMPTITSIAVKSLRRN